MLKESILESFYRYSEELKEHEAGYHSYIQGINQKENEGHYRMWLYINAKKNVAQLQYKLEFTVDSFDRENIKNRIAAEKEFVDIFFRRLWGV